MFIADGTYRFERGSRTNSFGDDVDVPLRTIENVPGAVSERNRLRASDAGATTVVRVVTGRFRPRTDVKQGDTVVNEQTGEKLTVDALVRPPGSSIMHGDTVVEMNRVGS